MGYAMALELRPYQDEAIRSVYNYFGNYNGNPLIVLPTGTGKSIVIAEFSRGAIQAWPDTRIIIATHSRELVKQNYLELCELWPFAPAGIYSAGLKQKDTQAQILFCGIQSSYKKAFQFQRCDILLIDEAHTVSEEDDTMWNKFISDLKIINPDMKIVGLTATDFRMKSGHLTELKPDGSAPIFTDVCYKYNILDAVKQNYLCDIISKNMLTQFDLSGVHKRGGEFIAGELEKAVNVDSVTKSAIDEIIELGANRKTWLLFCSGVDHAHAVSKELNSRGIECKVITGETPLDERDETLRRFKAGELRAVANNNVMTTGTNVPCIDLIAGLRPTESAGLHIQMLGRGMRLFPGKENCLYLDFARNVFRFGPLDRIKPKRPNSGDGDAPVKVCEAETPGIGNGKCNCVCFAGCRTCPDCGAPFPEPELKITAKAESAPILSNQIAPEWHEVMSVHYKMNFKIKDGKESRTMRVSYTTLNGVFSEFICFEHSGFPREKAISWHKTRNSDPVPKTIDEALGINYPQPSRIQVIPEGKYHRIKAYDFSKREEMGNVNNKVEYDDYEYDIPVL